MMTIPTVAELCASRRLALSRTAMNRDGRQDRKPCQSGSHTPTFRLAPKGGVFIIRPKPRGIIGPEGRHHRPSVRSWLADVGVCQIATPLAWDTAAPCRPSRT